MFTNMTFRLCGALTAGLLCIAGPASAQFSPRMSNDSVIGETYHIEGSAGFWTPASTMGISGEQFNVIGSNIDFKNDLGLTDQRFTSFQAVLHPAQKHKFRFQFVPIKYDQGPVTLTRELVFNGQRYTVGSPVVSSLDWKAYRFAYEYDFLSQDRWFAGVILEAKYTDFTASLLTPVINESIHARGPIPALGGIFRYYVIPRLSLTGELSGITVPASASQKYNAHYAEINAYGTMNVTNNFGAQFGYRTFNVAYQIDKDTGRFDLNGIYFGLVARY
ncbi:MAG: hypothetical protein LBQ09_06465 [Acidobacteriaceae bacterium]|jgi:hypothetical protein|nr:hypothetical protein [Acidobacteriaceae bacterium]